MDARGLARTLLPPVLADVLRRCCRSSGPIWEGVHARFENVPATGAGFDDPRWIEAACALTRRILEAAAHPGLPVPASEEERGLLAMLVVAHRARHGRVTVLDQLGYTLAFRETLARSYDRGNFPREYRLEHNVDLVFVCREEGLSGP